MNAGLKASGLHKDNPIPKYVNPQYLQLLAKKQNQTPITPVTPFKKVAPPAKKVVQSADSSEDEIQDMDETELFDVVIYTSPGVPLYG